MRSPFFFTSPPCWFAGRVRACPFGSAWLTGVGVHRGCRGWGGGILAEEVIATPKAVDECVKKRLANPDFQAPEGSDKNREQFAWALCQTLYKQGKLKGMTVEFDGKEYWSFDDVHWYPSEEGAGTVGGGLVLSPVTDDVIQELNQLLGAEHDKNEILKFSGAFLARQEVNKNGDKLSRKNLEDIARTLPLMPIDYEHREQEIVGLFIKGAVKGDGLGDGVATDGIVYARRRPDVALGLMDGTLELSIEADSESALCSVCNQVFKSQADYCSHLRTRLQGSGAEREFPGEMWAKGGAVTKSPAGTGTGVPRESIVMIASQMEVEKGGETVSEVVIDPWGQADEEAYFAVEFTDMEGKQQAEAKLNSQECKSQRKSDTKGGVMENEEFEKVKAELEKQIADLTAERDGLKTKLEAAEKERDDLQAKIELEAMAHVREMELAQYLSAEALKEQRETIAAMNDAAYELFKAALVGTEEQKAGIFGRVLPGTGEGDDKGDDPKVSWA